MRVLYVLPAALALAASVAHAYVQGHQPVCRWQITPTTVEAGCKTACPPPLDCCGHWHLNMQYDKCTSDGEYKKGSTTNKYFRAIDALCDGTCLQTGIATCSYFVEECTVVPCPGE